MTATRSSTLRARPIDWRFLLPGAPDASQFEHLMLLGGTPAIERAILETGLARRITTSVATDDPVDAIVSLTGSAASFSDAARHLAPDGVVYWEIDRRVRTQISMSPARATEHLAQLGLTAAAAYWVCPAFPKRQMFLPLGCPGVFQWYLETLFRTSPVARHAARSVLSRISQYADLTQWAPCYAITAVRGEPRRPAVLDRAAAEGIAIGQDEQAVLLAFGEMEWNRIVLLTFDRDGHAPKTAIKLARTPMFNGEVEWEHAVLTTLEADLPERYRGSLPQSRAFCWNGAAVAAETCVRGASLHSRAGLDRAVVRADFHAAVDWLAAFHLQTESERLPARDWLRQQLDNGRFAEYAQTFGLTDAEASLFAVMRQHAATLTTETVPMVWQHGDFGPPNIYIDKAQISAIDWETARRGPALTDLLYFATYWVAAAGGHTSDAQRRIQFTNLFCRASASGPSIEAAREEIASYMRRLDLSPTLLPFLLVHAFVDQALERVRRLAALGPEAALVRDENRFVPYVALLADHAHALFGQTPRAVSASDVTVAIATLGRPAGLARCVDAVLSGTTIPAEILIVDQSADTATSDLVASSGWGRTTTIRYIRQSVRGLAASRNAAIAHAANSVIAFTDDDCVPGEDWLTGIVAGFNAVERPDAVTGRVLPLGPEQPGLYAVSMRASAAEAVFRDRALPWAVGSGGNTAVKRDALQQIGGFDERLGAGTPGRSAEDVDLSYRLLRSGATVRYEPAAIVYHERQDARRRLASRPAYGFGMGAFCAMWLTRRDPYAMWMLTRWSYDRVRALAGSCVKGRWRRVKEEWLMLKGLVEGLPYGFSAARAQEESH